jgi:hypothetical protein
MARILSPVWSTARGRLGPHILASNQYWPIIQRDGVLPSPPSTPDRLAVQQALSWASLQWSTTLTPAQRDAWLRYALSSSRAFHYRPALRTGRSAFISGLSFHRFLVLARGLVSAPVFNPPSSPGLPGCLLVYQRPVPATFTIFYSWYNASPFTVCAYYQFNRFLLSDLRRYQGPWSAFSYLLITLNPWQRISGFDPGQPPGSVFVSRVSALPLAAPHVCLPRQDNLSAF